MINLFKINNGKRNSSVTDKVMDSIIALQPAETLRLPNSPRRIIAFNPSSRILTRELT